MQEFTPLIKDGDMENALREISNHIAHRQKCDEYVKNHPDTVKRFTLIALQEDPTLWDAYVQSRLPSSKKSNDSRL